MKIEAGKYFRTRDGRKAYVTAVELPGPDGECATWPVHCCVEDCSGEWFYGDKWNDGGLSCVRPEKDLVAEWKDDEPEHAPGTLLVVQDDGTLKPIGTMC